MDDVLEGTYRVKYEDPEGSVDEILVHAEDEYDADEAAREKLSAEHPSIDTDEWEILSVDGVRPDKETAMAAVDGYLQERFGEVPCYEIHEDGAAGWAFWIRSSDTTSYVHVDLKIEWYGTSWEPGQNEEEDADLGQEVEMPQAATSL